MAQIDISGSVQGIGSCIGNLSGRYAVIGATLGKGKLLSSPVIRILEDAVGVTGEVFYVDINGVETPVDVSALQNGKILVWREAVKKLVYEFPESVVGSPTWLSSLRDTPSNPALSVDEEFLGALSEKWTQTLTGSPVVIHDGKEAPSCYLVKCNATSEAAKLVQTFAPAGDFSITCKVSAFFGGFTSFQFFNLLILNTAENNGIIAVYDHTNASPGAYRIRMVQRVSGSDNQADSRTIGTDTALPRDMYLHIQRVGTSWTVLLSPSGLAWFPIATITDTSTTGKIILLVSDGSDGGKMSVAIDWIRRDLFTYVA